MKTVEQRKEFLELMTQVRGRDFTHGWLHSSYVYRHNAETEDAILDAYTVTLNKELLAQAKEKEHEQF